jgi:hypothetical protein
METINTTMNDMSVKRFKRLQGVIRLVTSTESLPLKKLLGSEGNIKIPSSTAIFNMASAKNCPSRKLGICKAAEQGAKCYAMKAEALYPQALPYRERQTKFWKSVSATEFVKQFLLINCGKKNSFTAVRFNESGDFHSQECVDKAEEIARILNLQGIKCYCYSSRHDLDFSKCKNLVVSGSNFTKKGVSNIFKIVKNIDEKPFGWAVCKGDCRICKLCLVRGQKVCIKKH